MNSHDAIVSLADVQRLLLPDNPQIQGLRFAAHYQPAAIAAGDYYDLMPLNHRVEDGNALLGAADAWGVMLADVSGHGPAAAMEAVQFDAILRTYRGDEPPGGPAGALTYANRHFFSRRPRPHYMTAFAALFRPDRNELSFVSAGHPPVLLRRGEEVLLLGSEGDIPLGIERNYTFSNHHTSMQSGDLLLAYTDGIIEALDHDGQAFGLQPLIDALIASQDGPQALLDTLIGRLHAHQGSHLGNDDQTLLALQPRWA